MFEAACITHPFIANPLGNRYNGPHRPGVRAESRVSQSLDFLKQLPLFAELTEAERAALAADFVSRRFDQGDMIFLQGDPGQALYLIETNGEWR